MTPDKLNRNLERLRREIARKPSSYTSRYGETIYDSFSIYTRTSTINLLLGTSEILHHYKWPFPAYALGDTKALWIIVIFTATRSLKVGVKTRINKFLGINNSGITTINDVLELHVNKLMPRMFLLCRKQIFSSFKKKSVFDGKDSLIDEVYNTFNKKYWYACMVSTLPLLDLVVRKYLKTNNLNKGISAILSMLRNAGISSKDVKPGHAAWDAALEKGEDGENAIKTDLRIVGVALGSFIDFAEIYYSFYNETGNEYTGEINRHAIVHCAAEDIWNRENAIKLIVFLDLVLRLEPALEILLKEN